MREKELRQAIVENHQEGQQKRTEIDLAMKNDPSRKNRDMLTVSVNSAMNLKPQSYTNVVIYQGNRMAQTGSARGARPTWNQPLMFEIEDFSSSVIISLQDENKSAMPMAGQELLKWEVSIQEV
jgi:hypothetical protein